MALPLTADLTSGSPESAQQTVGSGKTKVRVLYDPDDWRERLVAFYGDLNRAKAHGYIEYDPAGGTSYQTINITEIADDWQGAIISVTEGATFKVGSRAGDATGRTIIAEEF